MDNELGESLKRLNYRDPNPMEDVINPTASQTSVRYSVFPNVNSEPPGQKNSPADRLGIVIPKRYKLE